MSEGYCLHSIILELHALNQAVIPVATGHQAHALFLDLIRQVEPNLSERLHNEEGYRPFTVSPLLLTSSSFGNAANIRVLGNETQPFKLMPGQICRLRFTLLDGGHLWQCLSSRFMQTEPLKLQLGSAVFQLDRMLSTAQEDRNGWVGAVNWNDLVTPAPPVAHLNFQFATPTAFSRGERKFVLFPETAFFWDSLLKSWNTYAPIPVQLNKEALREFVEKHVILSDYDLHTTILQFPKYPQKGFVGNCTYKIDWTKDHFMGLQLQALARFSSYCGVGYKTTMGMGQVRCMSFRD